MHSKIVAGTIIFLLASCTEGNSHKVNTLVEFSKMESSQRPGQVSSVHLPVGYHRTSEKKGSFGEWLRLVPLKENTKVYLYDGSEKPNQSAQFAVLDISVGKRNLQQCADAIIRLRAEYLFGRSDFAKIRFTDNDGKVYQFEAPHTAGRFNVYLERVFGMFGTASLSKQLMSVNMVDMKPGDVFIRGGFPGHAVIVMDMAVNVNGEKIYLLAQSYMPAQDIHILNNPNDKEISPWYTLTNNDIIVTPEYQFTNKQLKTWW